MVDLYAEVRDIKTRLSVLEANTMSGMPGTSVKDRFKSLHGLMDMMGQCLGDKIDELKTEMAEGFAEVRHDISLLHAGQQQATLRFERIDGELAEMKGQFLRIDERFEKVDTRFEKVESDIAELKTDVAQLKTDVAELKTDVAELKTDVAQLKTDVAQLKTDVAELKGGMSDIKSMLFSLGAKAPVTA